MDAPGSVTPRVELARWFLDHDEVDEAARVLEPGDVLELGRSDSLDLAAALSRRGLSAAVAEGRLQVQAPARLAGEPRKPAARAAAPAISSVAKKLA